MTTNWLDKCEQLGIKPSIHTFGGWENQFARMLRWHEKVATATKNLDENGKLSAFEMDDILAYFQNCYYLREWLLKDGAVSQNSLENLFKASKPLQISQDICNSTKHFTINRPKVDKGFQIGRGAMPWGGDEYYFIYVGGERYDLFELVSSCQKEWIKFLSSQGLIKN